MCGMDLQKKGDCAGDISSLAYNTVMKNIWRRIPSDKHISPLDVPENPPATYKGKIRFQQATFAQIEATINKFAKFMPQKHSFCRASPKSKEKASIGKPDFHQYKIKLSKEAEARRLSFRVRGFGLQFSRF